MSIPGNFPRILETAFRAASIASFVIRIHSASASDKNIQE